MELSARERTDAVVNAARDRRALGIVVMDMRPATTICDYFVICHGRSPQHIEAISEEIREQMKKLDVQPGHVEGSRTGGWILIDYLHVVVHVFTEEMRRTYDLQRLWSNAKVIAEYADD